MSRVRSSGSKMEVKFRSGLHKIGIRYRKNVRGLYGNPDIAIKKYKIVIFIDSCFWHGCKKHCRMPITNRMYWNNKIMRNKIRDNLVTKYYKQNGWTIIRLWEHDLKSFPLKIEKRILNHIANFKN